MPNTILKRWNGTAFEELYPKTTTSQIAASGTPSSSTFLRGDGTWAVPSGVDNYVNITGDTMTGALSVNNNINGDRYYQNANGVATNNLGTPSVTEMALFDEQFDNKTAFYDITKYTFETFNGTTWTDVTSTISDANKKGLVGGDAGGSISIPNGTNRYRITIRNSGSYVYLNALYSYWSGNGNSTQVHFWRKRDDGSWTVVHNSTATISSWPGHMYMPFSTTPWSTSSTAGHWNEVRFEFVPTWSNGNTIQFYKFQLWGGYPSGKRNVYGTDENRNVAFPAALTGTRLVSNIATGTSPLLVTSTTAVTNLNADLLDGLHSTAFVSARTRSDWNNSPSIIGNVIGELAWKNYGNGHTIFDASNSTAPNGTSKNNTNPDVAWSATYPTLMGWNGTNTYGVRVDSARVSDSTTGNAATATTLQTARTINGVSFNGSANITVTATPNAHTHLISDVTNLQTSLDGKINTTARGAANGVAPLGADSRVPLANLPAFLTGASKGFQLVSTLGANTTLSTLITSLGGLGGNGYETLYGAMWVATTTLNITWTDQTTLGPVYTYHVLTPGDEGDSTSPVTLEAGDIIVFTKYSATGGSSGDSDDEEFTFSVINNNDPRFANYVPLTGGNITGTLNVSNTIGVGTTSPVLNSTGKFIHIHSPDTNASAIHFTNNTTGSGAAAGLIIGRWNDAVGKNFIYTYNNEPISFGTNNLERMFITGAGNVGIGRIDPQDLLNIHNSSANANIGFKITRGSQTHGLRLGVNDTHAFLWTTENQNLAFGTNDAQRITIAAAGNVGIGTTTPGSRLSILDSATFAGGTNFSMPHFSLGSGATGASGTTRLGIFVGNGNQSYLESIRTADDDNSTSFAIRVRGLDGVAERMRITGAGNVGINTTAPGERLEIVGNTKATTFISTQATGTAPLTVASTTAVTNLNADLLDGNHASAFLLTSAVKEQLKFLYIYGKAQSAITKGQAVQFAGVQGDHILMKPAVPSEINTNPDYFIGLAESTLATNDFGYILTQGELVGVNTSTYTAGNILWFASAGSTAGALTATEPTNLNARIQIASVNKVNATEGILFVRVEFVGTEIEDIVASGSPSSSTFLRGDGEWATPAGGGTVTGTGTANLLTYWTGTSSIGSLSTTTYPSLTELSYVKGTTGNIQSQLSGKAASSHTHGNITNAGAIGSTSGLVAVTTTSGVLTTEAKFTNLYTNSTPLTISSGGTQTITFSASASTTGVGTTGLPGTRLRIVWGTNTSTELVTYVTVKPNSGSDSYTYISEPLDVISGNDITALLNIRANATGAYSGTSWIVGGGKQRSPTGTDTNSTMYLRSIDRVNF